MLWIFFAVPAYASGDVVQSCTPRPALAGTYVLCSFEPSIHSAVHAAAIWQQLSLCIEIDHSVILFIFLFNRYTRCKRLHLGIDVELSLPEQVGSLLCHVKISGDSQSFVLLYVFSCSTLKVLVFWLFFGSFVMPRLLILRRCVVFRQQSESIRRSSLWILQWWHCLHGSFVHS